MKSQYLLIGLLLLSLTSCGKPSATPTAGVPAAPTPVPATSIPTPALSDSPAWFRDAIIYQVYPRSFYDSDGNGFGDLRGVTAKLDYVQSLGANTLLLTSVISAATPSGLDVLDFNTVAPELGTRDDMAELVRQAHSRNMHIMMDLPLTFVSNEFPLFKQSAVKAETGYTDWFQWQNTTHTAWKSFQNNRARPLLNLKNTALQTYLFQAAQEWLKTGLDGFQLPEADSAPHEFWQAFRAAVRQANPYTMLLGDVWETDSKKLAPYFQNEFDAVLNVPVYTILAGNPDRTGGGLLNGRTAPKDLGTVLSAQVYTTTAQFVVFAGADNTNRIASLVNRNGVGERLAAVLAVTLPGTPLIHYGDEIGMPGALGSGALGGEYRRPPMDWLKAGKGQGVPAWLKETSQANRADDGISVEEQQNNKTSLWSFYRLLIAQRTGHAALRSANYQTVASECRSCFAYLRWDANDFYLIVLNLSGDTQSVTLDLAKTPRPVTGPGEDLLLGGTVSLPSNGRYTLTLKDWDIRILRWGK